MGFLMTIGAGIIGGMFFLGGSIAAHEIIKRISWPLILSNAVAFILLSMFLLPWLGNIFMGFNNTFFFAPILCQVLGLLSKSFFVIACILFFLAFLAFIKCLFKWQIQPQSTQEEASSERKEP